MTLGDCVYFIEVREGACDTEDLVVGARAEAELVDGGLQESVGAAFKYAMFSLGGGTDTRVACKGAVVVSAPERQDALSGPEHCDYPHGVGEGPFKPQKPVNRKRLDVSRYSGDTPEQSEDGTHKYDLSNFHACIEE